MARRHAAARAALLGGLLLASCSDPAARPDAAPDARGDAAPDAAPDAPGGPCGAERFFTGEYVDWDSTDAAFHGIFEARWEVHGEPARASLTNPNGRFELCLAPAAETRVDVTPKGGYVPGVAIARADVLAAGALWSARSFTVARATSLLAGVGATYDAAAAQVFVHVDGPPRAVSLGAGPTAPLAYALAAGAWARGDTGYYVYFPNVDPAAGTAAIAVAGGAIGAGDVPLIAGAFTYATVSTR